MSFERTTWDARRHAAVLSNHARSNTVTGLVTPLAPACPVIDIRALRIARDRRRALAPARGPMGGAA